MTLFVHCCRRCLDKSLEVVERVDKEKKKMTGIRGRVGLTAVALALILGALMGVGVGEAAVGDVLASVTIPDAAGCVVSNPDTTTTVFGDAVAVVPGGKLGFPAIPTLVVTSCVRQVILDAGSTFTSKIFFLDPSTSPATLVSSINAGSSSWAALAFRDDTADLIGCQFGDGGPFISVIHFSPYDT